MAAEPEPRTPHATSRPTAAADDSREPASASRGDLGLQDAFESPLVTVPEAAFLLRVGARTVWRLMADPSSGFPRRRRIGGRTLLVRAELLEFIEKEARR